YCGAPIVHTTLINADPALREGIDWPVKAMVAGAAPPAAMIQGMSELGFEVTHVYGLTEVYGPAAACAQHDSWRALPLAEQVRLNGRQGLRYQLQQGLTVMDPQAMIEVPADGETMGEVMFRGNITMKGYLKNAEATEAAFAGGWFHTGDLGVIEPDGYVKLKDRAKDIIITGGENVSSLEVEELLYKHPAIMEAAVVARPDPHWGETVCAFVTPTAGANDLDAEQVKTWCREHLARYKVPRTVVFCALPKTSTGKIQKFLLREQAGTLDQG
ncbi:MAG: AMP-binding protein, partial [Gammaproteobacteria bacterium]|nr:AMP-binding protein [Gammaproteobacteria bacterium]